MNNEILKEQYDYFYTQSDMFAQIHQKQLLSIRSGSAPCENLVYLRRTYLVQ